MSQAPSREVAEALAALTRLHRHGILPLEEAREAARLIARDDKLEFPPPAQAAPPESQASDGSAPAPS